MHRFTMTLCLAAIALFALAFPVHAQTSTETPLLAVERLSIGFGIEKAWAFESFDVGDEIGNEWYAKVPFAYTLPTSLPAAITGRAEKSLTSRTVGFRLGVQVVLFRNGAWIGGQ